MTIIILMASQAKASYVAEIVGLSRYLLFTLGQCLKKQEWILVLTGNNFFIKKKRFWGQKWQGLASKLATILVHAHFCDY